ncbi:MAG: DUF1351 domain-containing protein [Clostridiales bacterium]|nr:DUF1351 domain-containing protein [Clostridiales bacterium]
MSELQVVVSQIPGKIKFNCEEIRDSLAERMALYKDAKFSDEYKAQARAEVASLRKIKKAIDDKRKEVKKQCMLPYEEFEEKAKELTDLIDEPIQLIDNQIKQMEERRKAQRREKIREAYQNAIGEMGEYLPLEKIYDPRWENASTTMKSIQDDLEKVITSTREAVHTLQSMASDAVPEALRKYKSSLDLSSAIAYLNQYEMQKVEIMRREEEKRRQEEERKRQQEEERIRRQERERIAEEERIRKEEREKAQRELEKEAVQEAVQGFFTGEADDILPFEQPSTVTAFYKIVATPEELEQVEMAFNSIGIFFERRDM